MIAASSNKPLVFLDFDGTVTSRDVIDVILETYADPQWVAVEEAWENGRIGSRDCLRAQMALVDASPEQINAIIDAIEIDPGFVPLVETCAAREVPIHIVSDGFDYCIQRILSRPSLGLGLHAEQFSIVSNHLEPRGRRWHVDFTTKESCVHGCGTCKPAAMTRINCYGRPTVFVGDGLSDQYAAGHADVVFAKKALAACCEARKISYTPFENLISVSQALDQLIQRMSPIS